MDNIKIGNFISELRKSKDLTQKELANMLNVTDKAVSKWERGVGYPEITIFPLLAESLGVSISELMLGGRIAATKDEPPMINVANTDAIVSDVMKYAEQTHEQKASRAKAIALKGLSIAFLIALFVCLLCNYVINKTFSWSLYVAGSEVTAWLMAAPFFIMKKHRFVTSLAGLTVAILPLLLLIEHLCPIKNWVIPFALPIVVISLVSLWISVILFVYTKIGRLYLTAFMFILFGVIVSPIINTFTSSYLNSHDENISVPIVAISSGFVAIVLFIIAFSNSHRQQKAE